MTDITWELPVDWMQNGNPTDEAGRIVSFTTRRGKRSDVWGESSYTYVNPGEFDVELDNYDRRYDPFYNPAAILTDNFTDTNGTDLADHTPDTYPVGSTWAKIWSEIAPENIDIQTNKASLADGEAAIYAIDSGISDVYMALTVNLGDWSVLLGDMYALVICRETDVDNYIGLKIDALNQEISIIEVVSGVETALITISATLEYSTNYAVILESDGIYINATVGTNRLGATSTEHTSATGIGIGGDNTGIGAMTFDSLTVSPFALATHIKPHRVTRLKAIYNGITYFLISGWMRDCPQQRTQLIQRARLNGKDGIDWLASQKAPHLALQTNYAVSGAIDSLITGAAWPFADTSGWILGTSELGIDTYLGSSVIVDNGDTIPYWWSDPTQSVMAQIRDLCNAYAGDAYVAADGTFEYKPRLSDDAPIFTVDGDIIDENVEIQQPWDELYNDIIVTAAPRQATASNTELFKLNYEPVIAAGETLEIWANFNYLGQQCPATSVTQPASTTDYTAGSTSGATDKTAQVSIASIVGTTYATAVKLLITNNDAAPVYLSLLKLRGTGIYNYSKVDARDEDTASSDPVTGYGKHSLAISSVWLQSTTVAADHAGYAKLAYANPRKVLIVKIEDLPEYQLAADLFDKVTVDIDDLGIDGTYVITYIEHQWSADDCMLRTIWRLTPSVQEVASFWILGESALDTETILGW